jgi:hypothetical protein
MSDLLLGQFSQLNFVCRSVYLLFSMLTAHFPVDFPSAFLTIYWPCPFFSVYLSVWQLAVPFYDCLSICLSDICPSAFLTIYWSCPFFCPSTYLAIDYPFSGCLSICLLTIYWSCPFFCPSTYLTIECPFPGCLFNYLLAVSIFLSIYLFDNWLPLFRLSVHLPVWLLTVPLHYLSEYPTVDCCSYICLLVSLSACWTHW